jgi:hypothetical protein
MIDGSRYRGSRVRPASARVLDQRRAAGHRVDVRLALLVVPAEHPGAAAQLHRRFDDVPERRLIVGGGQQGRGALDAMFAPADVRPMCARK